MKQRTIEERLTGGHPNSLGETVTVAEDVLRDPSETLMNELCATYSSEDEVVRLRVSSALKRVCGLHPDSLDVNIVARPEWVLARYDWLISEIGWGLNQPSAKWSIAQMIFALDTLLSKLQRKNAIKLLQHNLKTESDWIVQCSTSKTLTYLVVKQEDYELREWLLPELKKMEKDSRKSVANCGTKLLAELGEL